MGRNTAADLVMVGVAEYSFPPVLVLEGHPCHLAGPVVVVSGPAVEHCLSWFFDLFFFCLQGKSGKFPHRLHLEVLAPEVLAVSKVSPLEVTEALGMNAQQRKACF